MIEAEIVQRPYEGKRGTRSIDDPIHASPTEHQAQALAGNLPFFNLRGFRSLRSFIPNENAKDKRVRL